MYIHINAHLIIISGSRSIMIHAPREGLILQIVGTLQCPWIDL